ncbi:MAG TPA: transposase [Nitrososphaera sp.]|nr:transposase [Nitrososphaera sp.]
MLESLYFDNLISHIKQSFEQIPDSRSALNSTKPLSDALLSAFAVFVLKDRSLLQFIERLKERSANLQNIFKITTALSDTAVRQIIDPVDTKELKTVLHQPVGLLLREGVLKPYQFLNHYLLVAIDGTGYFRSPYVHCKNCCERQHRDGTATYYHNALYAVIVKPGEREVFPVAMEEITRQDGAIKNDGELAAVKRLLPQLAKALPAAGFVLTEDALFCNGPHIKEVQTAGLHFIIRIKEGFPLLQFESLLKEGAVQTFKVSAGSTKQVYQYVNALMLSGAHQDVTVNFLRYREVNSKTGAVLFEADWITDLDLTEHTVVEVAKGGRARWKIENETFNTLKNQGYQFEHNFGHGHENLCTNFALLMMLAFLTDQIQQRVNRLFHLALSEQKRLIRLWEKVREVFDMVCCNSMETIYKIIAKQLKLKIEIIT